MCHNASISALMTCFWTRHLEKSQGFGGTLSPTAPTWQTHLPVWGSKTRLNQVKHLYLDGSYAKRSRRPRGFSTPWPFLRKIHISGLFCDLQPRRKRAKSGLHSPLIMSAFGCWGAIDRAPVRTEPWQEARTRLSCTPSAGQTCLPNMLQFLFVIGRRWGVSLYKGRERRGGGHVCRATTNTSCSCAAAGGCGQAGTTRSEDTFLFHLVLLFLQRTWEKHLTTTWAFPELLFRGRKHGNAFNVWFLYRCEGSNRLKLFSCFWVSESEHSTLVFTAGKTKQGQIKQTHPLVSL